MTPAEQVSYLRTVVGYLDNLPILMAKGTEEQVYGELDRSRSTLNCVIRSLEATRAPIDSLAPAPPRLLDDAGGDALYRDGPILGCVKCEELE